MRAEKWWNTTSTRGLETNEAMGLGNWADKEKLRNQKLKGYCRVGGWGVVGEEEEIEKVKGHPCSKELPCNFVFCKGTCPRGLQIRWRGGRYSKARYQMNHSSGPWGRPG